MAQSDLDIDTLNLEEDNKGLPSMLNVLTILTIVASISFLLLGVFNYFNVCKNAEMIANREIPEVGGMLGKMMDTAIEMSVKQCESRVVILVSDTVTLLLCLFGAVLMRQRKKQGFIVYVLGELIGPTSMMTILGSNFTSSMFMIFGILMACVFVILYATQRKHLIY